MKTISAADANGISLACCAMWPRGKSSPSCRAANLWPPLALQSLKVANAKWPVNFAEPVTP